MKKAFFILIIITLFSCSRFSVDKGTVEDNNKQTSLRGPDEVSAEQEKDWIIIGGQRVKDFYKASKYYLKSEIEKIEKIQLWIDPKDLSRTINLKGIEQLVNLRTLHLYGWDLDALDYSPLFTLQNLRGILFECGEEDKLTKIPDLRGLVSRNNITSIGFEKCALTTLDNIEFLPNLRSAFIESTEVLSDIKALNSLRQLERLNMGSFKETNYRIDDISALVNLRVLYLSANMVDLEGIERLSSLEKLNLWGSDVRNNRFLSALHNLNYLYMTIRDPNPDIRFLEGMKYLEMLTIRADDAYVDWETREDDHVLDLTLIGNLSQLRHLELTGFTLQNVSALDVLEKLEQIFFFNSVLKDPSEKSRHPLMFYHSR